MSAKILSNLHIIIWSYDCMRVIDFISLGVEDMVYIISSHGSATVTWRGTRKDFIRELSAFFLLFHQTVVEFDVDSNYIVLLYI